MASTMIDRTDGLSSATAIKGPCRVVATSNIILNGLQTIDGQSLAAGDRVLVMGQTTASENGIWVVDTGNWRRAKDFSRTDDVRKGTWIIVSDGDTYSNSGWVVGTNNPIVVGTTALTITQNVIFNASHLEALEQSAEDSAAAATAAETAAEEAQGLAEAAAVSAAQSAASLIPQNFAAVDNAKATSINANIDYITTREFTQGEPRGEGRYRKIDDIDELLSMIWPVPPSNVLAYVPFHGPDGSTTPLDLSTYARSVTVQGNAVISSAQRLFGQNTAYFDGLGDRFDLADSAAFAFGSGNFTIDCWARFEDLDATRCIWAHTTNTTNYHALYVETDGTIQYDHLTGGSTTITLESAAATISAGQWYHIALVKNGTDFQIYVDRVSVAQVTDATSIADFTSTFRIGSFPTPVGNMKGWLCRLRIQNSAMWTTGYDFGVGNPEGYIAGPPWPRVGYDLMPESAYFRSADGALWCLWEDNPSVDQFGAVADADMSDATGTDNADAFDDLNAYMAVRRVSGRIGRGYYMIGREFVQTAEMPIVGVGKHACGTINRCNAYETGWRIFGGGVKAMTLSIGAYESRGPGRGDRQSNITLGDQKFFNGAPDYADKFVIEDVLLHAVNIGYTPSNAISCMATAYGGCIDRVSDEGSPINHNAFLLIHWGGTGKGDFVDVDVSYHNNKIDFGTLDIQSSDNGLWLSSLYDVAFDHVRIEADRTACWFFSGDETNRLAGSIADRVGRGVHINKLRIYDCQDNTVSPLIDFVSTGSSTFAQWPSPDAANGRFKDSLNFSITIDDILVVGSPNASKKIMRASEAIGRVRVGRLECIDVAGQILDFNRSRGFRFDWISGKSSYTSAAHIAVLRSSDLHIGHAELKGPDTTSGTGITVFGATENTTLDGNHSKDDTEILLDTAFTEDVLEGQPLLVGGYRVTVTKFAEAGNLRLFITALPDDVSTGATVTNSQICEAVNIGFKTIGFRYGIDVSDAYVTLRGPGPEGAGERGAIVRGTSHVDLIAPLFINNGVNRKDNGSLVTADIRVEECKGVVVHGGVLGRHGDQWTAYNVQCVATTDNRFTAMGTVFEGNAVSEYTTAEDIQLVACTDSAGALVSYP